jgi:hypothetical protein
MKEAAVAAKPRLECWSIRYYLATDEFAKPTGPSKRILAGRVSGHKHLRDGMRVSTSWLMRFDPAARIAQTENTEYELGAPDPTWTTWLEKNGFKPEDFAR